MLQYETDDELDNEPDNDGSVVAGVLCCFLILAVLAVVAYYVLKRPNRPPRMVPGQQPPMGYYQQPGMPPGQQPMAQPRVRPAAQTPARGEWQQPMAQPGVRPAAQTPARGQRQQSMAQPQVRPAAQTPARGQRQQSMAQPQVRPAAQTPARGQRQQPAQTPGQEVDSEGEKKPEPETRKKEDSKPQIIKQEIHYHYAPQYDQSKSETITEHITDSVYYKKDPEKLAGKKVGDFETGEKDEERPLDVEKEEVRNTCPECGAAVKPGWKICPKCTASLEKLE